MGGNGWVRVVQGGGGQCVQSRLRCRRHSRREPAESREPPPQPCADVSISVLCCCCQYVVFKHVSLSSKRSNVVSR